MESFHWEGYREALLFLATGGIIAPLFHRLRISPILGFLAAGAALGPFGLGRLAHEHEFLASFTLTDIESISRIAEFGLVFLLFTIGLELSWERLARMRVLVFGLGLAQVLACGAALSAISVYAGGLGAAPAIILGAALAMSSTAIVIPVLAERRRLNRAAGRASFAVLLMQDLMVAPLLFLVSFLADPETSRQGLGSLLAFLPALAAMGLLIVAGRLLLRPLFRLVAAADSTELFMAACLLVIIGSGVASAADGFSMGLGAFIAGLLLAETEFRREIEVTTEPFKGLLLGLFFVSVGAGLDLGRLVADPVPVLAIAGGLIVVKAAITFGLGRAFRLEAPVAAETALLIAPGGEFAFILLTGAIAGGLVPQRLGGDAMLAVTLGMFIVPALGRLGEWLNPGKRKQDIEAEYGHLAPEGDVAAGRVVIVGYGRVGALIGEMLGRHDIPFVAIDNQVKLVAEKRDAGVDIFWGNCMRREFLLRSGVAQARALVVTVEKADAAEEIVRVAHEARADMPIVARARDASHATHLYELGATDAIPETIEASLQLAETVLVDVGVPMGYVIASIHEKRDEFRKLLQPTGEEARRKHAARASVKLKEMKKRRTSLPAPAPREQEEGS
ncbi:MULTISPECIES: cation:proton antiporter domain-containing protein [Methylosinus]|uniref:Potassium transporter TrkA n=1 Tax=Methylosinus trichosporium (strain ATCC 35070 / NCIMB 11131 / UNIQEM 75 / OB3b) TaxID=595536 RepID=A0A2D2D202_METT3|nr:MULTISPECIES: cation:proton antiporter [Methylosinus]ATQ69004.1 potassium transporter TrkA [Methylosinus trichosporium OB3b]OBS51551.1 potassium transporter TrkA [Methylosinus sp. 3S-1]